MAKYSIDEFKVWLTNNNWGGSNFQEKFWTDKDSGCLTKLIVEEKKKEGIIDAFVEGKNYKGHDGKDWLFADSNKTANAYHKIAAKWKETLPKSLAELLAQGIKKNDEVGSMELKEGFFWDAQRFPDEVLDFSPFSNLTEIILIKDENSALFASNREYVSGQIKKIDVSKNKNLKTLIFPNNQLTEIDLSQNTQLETLNLSNNKLTDTLDLSNNPKLASLEIANNKLDFLILAKETYKKKKEIAKKKNISPQKHITTKLDLDNDITTPTSLDEENKSEDNIDNSDNSSENSETSDNNPSSIGWGKMFLYGGGIAVVLFGVAWLGKRIKSGFK